MFKVGVSLGGPSDTFKWVGKLPQNRYGKLPQKQYGLKVDKLFNFKTVKHEKKHI